MRILYLRLRAWAALIGFLAGFAPIMSGLHQPGDDPSCDPEFASRHPRVQIEAVVPPSPIEHCSLCHLQRAARGARTAPNAVAVWASRPVELRIPTDSRLIRSTASDQQPSRAPPTLGLI
jgi:hypothetical protein